MENRVSTSEFEAKSLAPNEHSVAVVGARGYSGVELARILLRHPHAKLVSCFATSEFSLSDYLPESTSRNVPSLAIGKLFESVAEKKLQTVFLATPVETSLELAPKLLEAGVNVIDLSGAYRLQQGCESERAAVYQKWYGVEYPELDLLSRAEFGLVPWIREISRSRLDARLGPHLIANPGCFATAVLLGVLPLLKAGLIDGSTLVIDAKSGTSGAGRKAEERLLHCEVDGLCLPYRIGRHQHEPEIQQYAMRFAEKEIAPFFTTHLLPVRRGIVASMYARLDAKLISDLTKTKKGNATADAIIEETFAAAYGHDPLIEFASLDRDGGERLLNLRRVVGSARTQIAYRVVDDRLYLFSLIDNLLKGAASQAVENFNRLIGVPTWTALSELGGVL